MVKNVLQDYANSAHFKSSFYNDDEYVKTSLQMLVYGALNSNKDIKNAKCFYSNMNKQQILEYLMKGQDFHHFRSLCYHTSNRFKPSTSDPKMGTVSTPHSYKVSIETIKIPEGVGLKSIKLVRRESQSDLQDRRKRLDQPYIGSFVFPPTSQPTDEQLDWLAKVNQIQSLINDYLVKKSQYIDYAFIYKNKDIAWQNKNRDRIQESVKINQLLDRMSRNVYCNLYTKILPVYQGASNQGLGNEGYTTLAQVQEMCDPYIEKFRDKIIYLPCDNETSQFFQYFLTNFKDFGLKGLYSTFYRDDCAVYGVKIENGALTRYKLEGNGDFLSSDVVRDYLTHSDIVVTNLPFNQDKEYLETVLTKNKDFLCITGWGKTVMSKSNPKISALVETNSLGIYPLNDRLFVGPSGTYMKEPVNLATIATTLASNISTIKPKVENLGVKNMMGIVNHHIPYVHNMWYLYNGKTSVVPDDIGYRDVVGVTAEALRRYDLSDWCIILNQNTEGIPVGWVDPIVFQEYSDGSTDTTDLYQFATYKRTCDNSSFQSVGSKWKRHCIHAEIANSDIDLTTIGSPRIWIGKKKDFEGCDIPTKRDIK